MEPCFTTRVRRNHGEQLRMYKHGVDGLLQHKPTEVIGAGASKQPKGVNNSVNV